MKADGTALSMTAGPERKASSRQPPQLSRVHRQPGHLIRRAQQIAVAIFLEECAAYGLTPVQYAALVAIDAHPDADATRLAALIAFDRSTIGDVLERLEAKQLIARRPSKSDKRIKLLRITPKGRRLLGRAEPKVEAAQQRILCPLSPSEQTTLMTLLGKLADAHNEISRAPQQSTRD